MRLPPLISLFPMLWIWTLLGALCLLTESSRILIYSPRMMQSHVNFMTRLANLLASRGHNVTVIDSILRYDIEHGLSEDVEGKEVEKQLKQGDVAKILWDSQPTPEDQRKVMNGLGQVHREQCLYLTRQDFIKKWKNVHFDIGIHEIFDTCGIGIMAAIGVNKTVIVSSTVMMEAVAIAIGHYSPIQEPSLLSDYGNNLGYLDLIRNLKFHSAWAHFFEMQSKLQEKTFKELWGVRQTSEDLIRQTSAVFVNTDPIADARRNHEKTKLFISHCGQNSMLESLKAGTELLTVPMFGDQHRNARAAEENGLVTRVEKNDLGNSKKLISKIKLILVHKKNEKAKLTVKRNLEMAMSSSRDLFMWALLTAWFLMVALLSVVMFLRLTFFLYLLMGLPLGLTISFYLFRNYQVRGLSKQRFFSGFRIGGHRGSPHHAPENTIASFQKAKEEGCQLVEFDVHVTADGVPIVIHDVTTYRTSNVNKCVLKTSWQDLRDTKLNSVNNIGGSLATLEEVVDWCKKNDMKMLFDVKVAEERLLGKIAEIFSKERLYETAIVSSFNPLVPYRLKRINHQILTGLTLDRSYYTYEDDDRKLPFASNSIYHWLNSFWDDLTFITSRTYLMPRFLGVEMLLINYKQADERTIEDARDNGMEVVVYTANSEAVIGWLSTLPVSFLTDVPFNVNHTKLIKP
ncbi:unnamed protein product [Caenorhabditis auriculariae]|uniref:GP-PDE domain-containing protein n=1 Tax=Caenorhabditis auriculariae TaxID=2777116 RepID=A0A8S1GSR0_9PELO|nr:unnamed protein product [Caenorhabditis auriculariae]